MGGGLERSRWPEKLQQSPFERLDNRKRGLAWGLVAFGAAHKALSRNLSRARLEPRATLTSHEILHDSRGNFILGYSLAIWPSWLSHPSAIQAYWWTLWVKSSLTNRVGRSLRSWARLPTCLNERIERQIFASKPAKSILDTLSRTLACT